MLKCTTVRSGSECPFMSKCGCLVIDGKCLPIVEQCKGCSRVIQYNGQTFCSSYTNPMQKWLRGKCSLATHLEKVNNSSTKKINPLKASKMAAKSKKKGRK